jgi:hypothetical protein
MKGCFWDVCHFAHKAKSVSNILKGVSFFSSRFLTCGYDGSVILWDGVAHSDLWTIQASGGGSSQRYKPCPPAEREGSLLRDLPRRRGLGGGDAGRSAAPRHRAGRGTRHAGGRQYGLCGYSAMRPQSLGEAIEAVSFSPNGRLLAAAGHGRVVHVFRWWPGLSQTMLPGNEPI